jgi:hypothetical protein
VSGADRPDRWRRWPGVAAWGLWALVVFGIAVAARFEQLLRRAGRPDLAGTGAENVPLLLAMVSAATVGALLASRRPRHPVGWLLLGLGLSLMATGAAVGYASYGLLAGPAPLPGARFMALAGTEQWILWPVIIGFVLLLTPTGSLPSPRWRWWARATAVAPVIYLLATVVVPLPLEAPFQSVVSPLAVPALAGGPLRGPLLAVRWLALILAQLALLAGAGSLVVRFRRARGIERLQLRWVALAAALAAVAAAVVVAGTVTGIEALWLWATAGYVAVLPLAVGAAILRYRLYDLDRIVNRTVVYGLLSVLLGLGYAGAALALGQLVGGNDSLAVAGATLAVAAGFQPARRRVQRLVDRRFNRRRYDAARTIQGFSARLREEVDLDTLTGELLAVVDQTMQPTRVSLWLRPR